MATFLTCVLHSGLVSHGGGVLLPASRPLSTASTLRMGLFRNRKSTSVVVSWYDQGLRLTGNDDALVLETTPDSDVASWYDQGLRIGQEAVVAQVLPEVMTEVMTEEVMTEEREVMMALLRARARDGRAELTELGQFIDAAEQAGVSMSSDTMLAAVEYVESKGGFRVRAAEAIKRIKGAAPINPDEQVAKDIGNAVGLIAGVGALAAIGLDVASLDLDVLVLGVGAGAAVLAEEDKGVVGSSLRAVGNVANPVLNLTTNTAKAAADYSEEKELGWYTKAAALLGLEWGVRKVRGIAPPPPPPPPPPLPERKFAWPWEAEEVPPPPPPERNFAWPWEAEEPVPPPPPPPEPKFAWPWET